MLKCFITKKTQINKQFKNISSIKIEIGSGEKLGENGWLTLDFIGTDINWDLRNGMPFENDTIDEIYSSHLFEHLTFNEASVLFDEWSNKPKKEKVKVDTNLIKTKSQQWMDIIDGLIENASDESLDDAKKMIKKYKDKLKKYRTCGLEKQGEYSDENLVFKVLRRNGYIEKLYDFENKYSDKKLSLKEKHRL